MTLTHGKSSSVPDLPVFALAIGKTEPTTEHDEESAFQRFLEWLRDIRSAARRASIRPVLVDDEGSPYIPLPSRDGDDITQIVPDPNGGWRLVVCAGFVTRVAALGSTVESVLQQWELMT